MKGGVNSSFIDFNFALGMTLNCSGYDVKFVCCVLGMTLNSSVLVRGATVELRPQMRFVNEVVSDGRGIVGMACMGLYSNYSCFIECDRHYYYHYQF